MLASERSLRNKMATKNYDYLQEYSTYTRFTVVNFIAKKVDLFGYFYVINVEVFITTNKLILICHIT